MRRAQGQSLQVLPISTKLMSPSENLALDAQQVPPGEEHDSGHRDRGGKGQDEDGADRP